MKSYDHSRIEKKWQKVWKQTDLYRQRLKIRDSKCYVLDMFPYPSGEGLHVGHPKGYIATDVYSRMKRMQGHSILHPMGWDAFGLPAENYAIANKIHPAKAVAKNIKRFKKQLELLGFNYDWEREINTTDPHYYKWTQWIFLQMFHRGLAYRSNEPINWCPSCKTGLANEDLEDGKCERCGSVVEKRAIPQWVLKITDYADRLLAGLDTLDWPQNIKEQQRNWIGRSEGAEIEFRIKNYELGIKVFTTRADTLFGATYLVLAPEHPILGNLESRISNLEEVKKYQSEASKRTEIERVAEGKEKTGVEIRGIKAVNPANGEEIPVWIADYVLSEYGTGAIMAVPAHDARDFEFTKKYNLPIKMVVCQHYPAPTCPILDAAYIGEGYLVDSGKFAGMKSEEARWAVTEAVGGKITVKYKLRDWVFSRQRYWGEPIPLIFCEDCRKRVESTVNPSLLSTDTKSQKSKVKSSGFSLGERLNPGWIGVAEKKLPVKLPKVKSYEPTGTGESPLAAIETFVNTKCPKCGGPARRETNTMPQWAGSCWYHLAYAAKQNSEFRIQNSVRLRRWLPVDMYVGGAEHATRHLIYARFWHKFLHDIGVVSTVEAFARLQNVGLILASDGRKMSKRFGNVINPDDMVKRFGADTLRVYEMFMGPFNQAIAWSTESLVGSRRFLERVFRLHEKVSSSRIKPTRPDSHSGGGEGVTIEPLLHQTIQKVGHDIEAFRFNTAVSSLMILQNSFEKMGHISTETFETFLKLLAPFAPHLAEELWCARGRKTSIHKETWPRHDEKLARGSSVTIVAQVDGKTRGTFEAQRGWPAEKLKAEALTLLSVQKWTSGKAIRNVVAVPDRLVNIVTG